MEVSGKSHNSDHLSLGTEHPYPLHRRLGGPKSQSGLFFEKRKMSCPFRNFKPSHNVISYSEATEENLWVLEGSAIPHVYLWVMKAKWLY
jgi:hypothetical protein